MGGISNNYLCIMAKFLTTHQRSYNMSRIRSKVPNLNSCSKIERNIQRDVQNRCINHVKLYMEAAKERGFPYSWD